MFGGAIAGEFGRGEWSAEVVGRLMTGFIGAPGKAGA
jgi:hypothetical protein